MTRARRIAWILILIVDIGLIAWGAMAALAPAHLLGPGGGPILPAEYHGYSGHEWSELTRTSPMAGAFMLVLFRVYGSYCAAFGLIAGAITVPHFAAVMIGHGGRRSSATASHFCRPSDSIGS